MELWREQLLTLRLFREISDRAGRQPGRPSIASPCWRRSCTRMPYEDYEKVFNTFVRWSRFGGLFHYDEAEQRLGLDFEHA